MRASKKPLLLLTLVVGVAAWALAPTLADDDVQSRVILTDGRELVGVVTEHANHYTIRTRSNIEVTYKKSDVLRIEAIEPAAGGPAEAKGDSDSFRRAITDGEIDEILGSEPLDIEALGFIENIDLTAPLTTDQDSLEYMLRVAGSQAETLETDHFVLVYTSSKAGAVNLAARLEAIYKWRVWFMEAMGIPPAQPENRLEMYYFGTHEEFDGYSALHGFRELGVLGFYSYMDNRSAFFDMYTWPPVKNKVEKYKNPEIDFDLRRRKNNLIQRYVESYNLIIIQHEAGHHIDHNIGFFPTFADIPTWLIEGFTMQFEAPPNELGASFGRINYERLREIRELYGPNGENLPPMRQFMVSDGMWRAGGGASYPIGWALVHYLYVNFHDELSAYMKLMAQAESDRSNRMSGEERLEVLEKFFGKIDDEWIQKFKDYLAGLPLPESKLAPRANEID